VSVLHAFSVFALLPFNKGDTASSCPWGLQEDQVARSIIFTPLTECEAFLEILVGNKQK
jgi:hypothetical protein